MLALFRKPIAWMVLAECVVLAALVGVAWQMVAGARPSSAVPSTVFAPPSAQPDGAAPSLPDLADRPPGESGPLPRLNVTIGFWRARLGDLNREEEAFERLEWSIVHTVTSAIRSYVESVVLPAVARAERGALPRRPP